VADDEWGKCIKAYIVAIYNYADIRGVVGFMDIYPEVKHIPDMKELMTGLSRIRAIRLISNMQNKLVEKPFYNPDFISEDTTPIDVPRFFFGPGNEQEVLECIQRYRDQFRRSRNASSRPLEYAASAETPLILLRTIMSIPESRGQVDVPRMERNLYKAFLIANHVTMNKEHGEFPCKPEEDREMYLAYVMMSMFCSVDFTNQKQDLNERLINQNVRCIEFFEFIRQDDELKGLYQDFLNEYHTDSWQSFFKTIWSIIALAGNKTGVVNFENITDTDHLMAESIIDKDAIDISETIRWEDNIDYTAFRQRPFIRIAPHEYAIIDLGFVIDRLFNGIYFIFNDLWKKKHPDKEKFFNIWFTSEFSEKRIFDGVLDVVVRSQGYFGLSDAQCLQITKRTSSPPDYYIKDGNNVILFENKDVKIKKEVKEKGILAELIAETDKKFVGYMEGGKFRPKGVGQLVANAKRIQEGTFAFDTGVNKDSIIYLVLVVADNRQVTAGWKNYLNRKMIEECMRQGVDESRIRPLILTDLGTLMMYKKNFMNNGLFGYFDDYINKTQFDANKLKGKNLYKAALNMALSFSGYMNNERSMSIKDMSKRTMEQLKHKSQGKSSRSHVTKTLEYADLYDDEPKETAAYLEGIDRSWLITSVCYLISVDNFNSYSMPAQKCLLVLLQNHMKNDEVKRLFDRLDEVVAKHPKSVYPTLINHQALFQLLRVVLLKDDEENGEKDTLKAYLGLLKAVLLENTNEMERDKASINSMLNDPMMNSKLMLQQDLLNMGLFGMNHVEEEKMQQLRFLVLAQYAKRMDAILAKALNNHIWNRMLKNPLVFMLTANMPLKVYHDVGFGGEGITKVEKAEFKNALSLWEDFESFVSERCIDVRDGQNLSETFSEYNMKGLHSFREKPVLKMTDEEYILVQRGFYAKLVYDKFLWDLRREYESLNQGRNFLSMLTSEFSEKWLFAETVKSMIGHKRIIWNNVFKKGHPAPDMTIRTRHNIYIFEFKDLKLPREVVDGHDMNAFMAFVDKKLDHEKDEKLGDKGIPQLVKDIEEFFNGEFPYEKDHKKGNVKVHPILVVNDKTFSARGFNNIMEDKFVKRVNANETLQKRQREIDHLLVMDFDILFMCSVRTRGNFAHFAYMVNSYFHNCLQSSNVMQQNESFRNYWMNKWADNMGKHSKNEFSKSFRKQIRKLAEI